MELLLLFLLGALTGLFYVGLIWLPLWLIYRMLKFLAWLATPSDKPVQDHLYDPDTYYIEEK